MDDDNLTYFEKRILSELAQIETKLKELELEKQVLGKQLAKAKAEQTGLQTVTRKNSLNRVIAENSITEALKEDCSLSTKKLYNNARLTNHGLKETTFRTYLHRMKKRGIIKTSKYIGTWELTNDYINAIKA
ncbi:MAG: hypothetical protein L3J83_11015 [Proteobacteria bacterium]|nr:hypothetical protein [Pseudomonadota bacterium]